MPKVQPVQTDKTVKSSPARSSAPQIGQSTDSILQRLESAPASLRPADVEHLQRTIGNEATSHFLQAKLKLGPAGDAYEQEADRVAKQVVRASRQSKPAPKEAQQEGIQRDELDEEMMQAKPLAERITPVQRTFVAPPPNFRKVQRDDLEDDELQAAPNHGFEGGDVDTDVARTIESAKGGGQPLHDGVRSSMEQGFGADFGGVRVHTGGQADELNRSLNARAFTTGSDIFFGKGQYDPGSTGGQELIAHELTHTVQQGAAGVARTFQPTTKADPQVVQPYRSIRPEDYAVGDQGAKFVTQKLERPGGIPQYVSETKEVREGSRGLESTYEKRDIKNQNVLAQTQERGGYVTTPPLKVANTGEMAIEDSGGEAKVFYATDAVAQESNRKLTKIGSAIGLDANASESLEVPDVNDTYHTVKMLRPTYRGVLNDTIGAISICTDFVKNILGVTENGSRVAVLQKAQWEQGTSTEPEYEAPISNSESEPIKEIVGYMNRDRFEGARGLKDDLQGFSTSDVDRDSGEVITEYQGMSRSRLGGRSRELGINQYANPEVGEGYVTSSIREAPDEGRFSTVQYLHAINQVANSTKQQKAAMHKNIRMLDHIWGIHYAGVIAKSGSDTVTFENYNRDQIIKWEVDTLINGLLQQFNAFQGIVTNAIQDPTDTDITGGISPTLVTRIAELRKVIIKAKDIGGLGVALQQRLDEYATSYAGVMGSSNKLYHFKMYGQEEGQSFHEQWKDVTENSVTLRIRESGSIMQNNTVQRIQTKSNDAVVALGRVQGGLHSRGVIDQLIQNMIRLGDQHILLVDEANAVRDYKAIESQFDILMKREATSSLYDLFDNSQTVTGQQVQLPGEPTCDSVIALINQWITANSKFTFSRTESALRRQRVGHLTYIRTAVNALKAAFNI